MQNSVVTEPLGARMCGRKICNKSIVVIIAGLVLAGCTSRGELAYLPQNAQPASVETILVSTSRQAAPAPEFFGTERSYETNYAMYEVAVPPDRKPGELEYPKRGKVDPSQEFLLASATPLSGQDGFVRAVDAEIKKQPPGVRKGAIFVHGFNTNHAEGVMRAVALAVDTGHEGVTVVYSWPSAASVWRYLDDRESALFARDSLTETLSAMSRSQLSDYVVLAHSMGTFVTMDTMRELAQAQNRQVLGKISAVVLLSADLDVDVFLKQAPPVLDAGIPIILLTAEDDLALRLSARLRGQSDRVGDITSPSRLGGLNVLVLDFSDVESGDSLRHFKVGSSPEVLGFLKYLNQSGDNLLETLTTSSGLSPEAAAELSEATGIVFAQ